MTTNKPEVVAYRHVNKEHPTLRGVSLLQDPSCYNELVKVEPLIRLSDYEALQAENEELKHALAESRANDLTAMGYLNQIRQLVGGDDFPDMVEKVKQLQSKLNAHKVSRIAYASEFPSGADGTPDVGSIHENIRLLKKDAERYRFLCDPVGADEDYVAHAVNTLNSWADKTEIDQAIDAAMQEEPECGCCGQTAKCDDDCDAVVLRKAEQKPAPDVAGLVEALERVREQVDGNIRETVRDCVNGRPDVQDIYEYCDSIDAIIDTALAAHRKGGE